MLNSRRLEREDSRILTNGNAREFLANMLLNCPFHTVSIALWKSSIQLLCHLCLKIYPETLLSAFLALTKACLNCSLSREKSRVLAGLLSRISRKIPITDAHGASTKLSSKTPRISSVQSMISTRLHPLLFLWLSLWKQCVISTTLTKLRWSLASCNQSWTKTDQQRTLPSHRSLFCANSTRNHFPMTLSKNFAGKRIQTSKSLALKDKCLRCLSTNFTWSTLTCS